MSLTCIDVCARQVALEKRMRDVAKQYEVERKDRARERAQAAKRQRQQQLELMKTQELLQQQRAAINTYMQRERRCET
jgi:hypothetical protein